MVCMERTLYHGSEFIIKKPEFLKGNIHNDYGIGFYCTTNKELAKEWAVKRSGKGYINKYILRDDRLKILDGIYMNPKYSFLLNEYLPCNIFDLSECIARKFGWDIVPTGEVAINYFEVVKSRIYFVLIGNC